MQALKLFWSYRKLLPSRKDPKEIIILGMHRSGTSLVSGILNALDVYTGKDFDEPTPSNPVSHFEDIDFRKLNDKILKNARGSWDRPPKGSVILKSKEEFSESIASLINKRARHKIWGWKDPRTVLTIRVYLLYLKNPYFVVCYRNPLEIARSLKERDGLSIEQGLRLAVTYNERIIDFFEEYPELPKIFISFEDVMANSVEEAKRLARFLGLELTGEKIQQIKKFILPINRIQRQRERIQKNIEKDLRKSLKSYQGELHNIYNSRGWKIISFFHNVRLRTPFLNKL